MLVALRINNYVLIDSLEVDFPAGLVIITGETGAGKSILLGALGLLTGSKSDASVVGPASNTCVVEGDFDCAADPGLESYFKENDLPWNGGDLTIRRVVSATGRSRCFVCDEPVSRDVLSAISSRLVDIHSQHQNLRLSDEGFRLSVLDAYAGVSNLKNEFETLWRKQCAGRRRLEEVNSTLARLALERDFNELMFRQLEEARLQVGELEALETEHKQLANAEEIKFSLSKAESFLEGSGDDALPVSATLREASKLLSKVGAYLPDAVLLSDRVDAVKAEIEDVLSEVSALSESTVISKDRLEAVESRMSLLYSLMSKHSVRTVEELIAVRGSLNERLSGADELLDEKSVLETAIREADGRLAKIASLLHEKRSSAAATFAEAVMSSLRTLSMDNAVFGVEIETVPMSSSGTDLVRFVFSATGGVPADVSKSASGGEISRIMLCVKNLMARYMAMPTMVFDEIDTGISGSVADAVGAMICRMGKDIQVLAITHLPQVAAKGDAHLLVLKEVMPNGRAISRIKLLSAEERVAEIARMLSGSAVTPEAMANAKSLLQNSRDNR